MKVSIDEICQSMSYSHWMRDWKSPYRISTPEVDTSRDDDSEFKLWFGQSCVVDENGDPLIVFRGEHGETLLESRVALFAFGSLKAANCYATYPNDRQDTPETPKIIPAYLKIENPFVFDSNDPFVDLTLFCKVLGFRRGIEIAREYENSIMYTDNWRDNFAHECDSVEELLDSEPRRMAELYDDIFPFLDDHRIVNELRLRGFDGAVYGGMGENTLEAEYRVFSSIQICSAIGARLSPRYLGIDPESDS